MTLRDLIKSVDAEQYADNALFQKLCVAQPEYGSPMRIKVKRVVERIAITNTHIGSLGDRLMYKIDVDPDLNISKEQLLDAILKEMARDGFDETAKTEYWNNFDDLQKAKLLR